LERLGERQTELLLAAKWQLSMQISDVTLQLVYAYKSGAVAMLALLTIE
jgi:hypothetical protein